MAEKIKLTNETVLMSLFAAFICVGCFIQVPFLGGVPIVFQDMLAIFAGLMLGPIYGVGAVIIFLCMGILGFPVFSGKAGLHVILQGVTGGFLIGYLFAAFAAGIFTKFFFKYSTGKAKECVVLFFAVVTAMIVIFTCGVVGFMRVTHSGFAATLTLVVVPFIPGTIIKVILLVLLGRKFCPIINNYISR